MLFCWLLPYREARQVQVADEIKRSRCNAATLDIERTLIGENHGLAVTLTHGGLQWGVGAGVVNYASRQAGAMREVQRGDKGRIRREMAGGSSDGGQGRISRGRRALCSLDAQHHRAGGSNVRSVGLRQRAGVARRALKGGTQF